MSNTKISLSHYADEDATWLITGAAGFIGSSLLKTLLDNDQRVIGLDDFFSGYLQGSSTGGYAPEYDVKRGLTEAVLIIQSTYADTPLWTQVIAKDTTQMKSLHTQLR